MPQENRQARLEARVAPEVHALLKRAAEIEGRTMSDFVVSAARSAAIETIEQTEIIRLGRESSEQFADLLINPPPITASMKRAKQKHEKLVESR